jgi:prepilin-type N-terminal cleavage/methylation domain-containing protein
MLVYKRGFTLVELLAVIVILAIILTIAVPNIIKIINNSKEKSYESQLELIKDATKKYIISNPELQPLDGTSIDIYLKDLQDEGMLPNPLKNPKGGDFDNSKPPGGEGAKVTVTRIGDKYTYTFIDSNNSDSELALRQPEPGEIVINSADILAKIGHDETYPLDGNYIQMANIDLSGYVAGDGWVPIGNDINKFTGKFDGNGFMISNLTINSADARYLGIFGYVDGSELSNISLTDVSVNGDGYVSIIGSLVGYNEGTIKNCYSAGTISGSPEGSIGGLVGLNYGTILDSSYQGSIIGRTLARAGGLVGSNDGNISGCYFNGSVTSPFGVVGGLVGSNCGTISNCYSTGSASGGIYNGGLVGVNGEAGPEPVSGIIEHCYSIGYVEGQYFIGGLVGRNAIGPITHCYWDIETSDQDISAGGIGMTTVQMKQQSTFSGWNFNDIWQINEGQSYPYFRNNEQAPHPQ